MVSDEEVKKIAALARLEVSDDEARGLAPVLGAILDYVKQLDAVDTTGVEAMSHVHGVNNVFREDEIVELVEPGGILAQAPELKDNFYRVPLIIESSDK